MWYSHLNVFISPHNYITLTPDTGSTYRPWPFSMACVTWIDAVAAWPFKEVGLSLMSDTCVLSFGHDCDIHWLRINSYNNRYIRYTKCKKRWLNIKKKQISCIVNNSDRAALPGPAIMMICCAVWCGVDVAESLKPVPQHFDNRSFTIFDEACLVRPLVLNYGSFFRRTRNS